MTTVGRVVVLWVGTSIPLGLLLASFLHQGGAGRVPRPSTARP